MKIIELVLDEGGEALGVDAISIVEHPAIEMDFITLNEHTKEVKLKSIDEERRILLGAALVPNKMIYRKGADEDFYIYFSNDTIRKASEMFLSGGNQNNSTLEHEEKLTGLSVVESWIVEDKDKDKTSLYGLDVPVGTWMVSMKVYNEDVWQEFVKSGKVKGFSIEGYFSNKAQLSEQNQEEKEAEAALKTIIDLMKDANI